MSIRVGLRPMGRRIALPVGAWPMEPVEYVFIEGPVSPYDIFYDDVAGSGPFLASAVDYDVALNGNNNRNITRMSDGTLYVIYQKVLAGKEQIYVKQSADDGATWTDETRISTRTGMENYKHYDMGIAVDSEDYLHVVWRGCITGYPVNYQIWYTKYTDSWSNPVRISDEIGMENYTQWRPAISVDSNDYLHVVWYGRATGYASNQIWYTKYTNAWGSVTRLSTKATMNTNIQRYPTIEVDSLDNLHVLWAGATDIFANWQIWYTKYTEAWSDPLRISTGGGMEAGLQYDVSLAVDSNDYLHVVWSGPATGWGVEVWYVKHDGGWSTPLRISDALGMDGYSQISPHIAIDSDDNLHVLWYGKATGYTTHEVIWYALYTTSWATPICLQPTGKNIRPSVRWSRWP